MESMHCTKLVPVLTTHIDLPEAYSLHLLETKCKLHNYGEYISPKGFTESVNLSIIVFVQTSFAEKLYTSPTIQDIFRF